MNRDDSVSKVASRINIVELISEYVPLKKAGVNFKGLCPFHGEKTPSFVVSSEKQIFHCFGCHEGGDMFSFIMKHDRLTFPEALRYLAEKCGVVLEEREFRSDKSQQKTGELRKLNQAALAFYQNFLLKDSTAEEARDYLALRGYTKKTVEKFKLGFAPRDSQSLLKHLVQKEFSENIFQESGLFREKQQGNFQSLFFNRLIFPIFNARDEVIAFGGRVLDNALPKYVNSPETKFFKKREELYGLNWAKRAISQAGHVIVVEGYFDVIRLHECGFEQSVATLGTALTEGHARILRRYTQQIIVLFDNDSAGINAALRGIEVVVEEGLFVKVLMLPGSKDPDAFLKENTPEAFETLIRESALDFFDFKLKLLLEKYDPSNASQLSLIAAEMFGLLGKVQDQIILDQYLQKLAKRLNIREQTLRFEFQKKNKREKKRTPFEELEKKEEVLREDQIELGLLSVIVRQPFLLKELKTSGLVVEHFCDKRVQEVLKSYQDQVDENEGYEGLQIVPVTLTDNTKHLVSELLMRDFKVEFPDRYLEARIREIKIRNKEQERKTLRLKMDKLSEDGKDDSEEFSQYYQDLMVLKREISELKMGSTSVVPNTEG